MGPPMPDAARLERKLLRAAGDAIADFALIEVDRHEVEADRRALAQPHEDVQEGVAVDRKSTRLNSSHGYISYAVFCLEKNTRVSSTALGSDGGTYYSVEDADATLA